MRASDRDNALGGWLAVGDALEPGLRIGRYLYVSSVGQGGMGTVLLAYDPKLQREVAIKLVDSSRLTADSESRLMREARMMARLKHPNVVAVHDVEVLAHRGVIVVMEYVKGQTLATWMLERQPWEQVVRTFVEAGRGLAAAHDAGLLHRDFKPSNVLIGHDGRVRVTDFGLARAQEWEPSVDDAVGAGDGPDGSTQGALLTQTGTVRGTPAFMAPEQAAGEELTPRADQYAFCVSLWQALTGSLPFSAGALSAKEKGPPAWPAESTVPRRIAGVLARGLDASPERRWPSMRALLDALRVGPSRTRRTILAVLGGVVLAGGVGAGVQSWASTRADQCTGAARQITEGWGEAQRDTVKAAMLETGVPYADAAWVRTERDLDRYAADWIGMYTETCEAATVRGEQSSEVMDLRMACLHRAKLELTAVTGLLVRADAVITNKAGDVMAGLPPLSRCADLEALRAEVEPPLPEDADAVEQIRALLAEAKAEQRAGRYTEAQGRVGEARARVADVRYGPVASEVALREGIVLDALSNYGAAELALREALKQSSRWRQTEQMHAAATALMSVVGYRQQRTEEGLRFRELAEGLAEGDPVGRAKTRQALARILVVQGKYTESEAEQRRVIAALEQELGAQHPSVLGARNGLAIVLDKQGKFAEAEVEQRLNLALKAETLGASHPSVALTRGNLAAVLFNQGKFEEAEAGHRRALASLIEALGPENLRAAESRSNLASVLAMRGKYAAAEAEQRRVIALFEKGLGPEHGNVVTARRQLARVLLANGRFAEAEAEHRWGLEVLEKTRGPHHPDVAGLRRELAGGLAAQRRYADAEAELRVALADSKRALGPDHAQVADTVSNLAGVLHRQGKRAAARREFRRAMELMDTPFWEDHVGAAWSRASFANLLLDLDENVEALALARKAWTRLERDDVAPGWRAHSAFVLAKALWASGDRTADREHARDMALVARELYASAGEGFVDGRADVLAWLDAHGVR